MNINLKELSNEELFKLSKQLKTELEKRDKVTKESTLVGYRFYKLFREELMKEINQEMPPIDFKKGVFTSTYPPSNQEKQNAWDKGSFVWGHIKEMERAVFKLADVTLKNYKWKLTKDKSKVTMQVNGSVVLANDKAYKAMCDEIVDIVKKYHENVKGANE